jgi:hypothetical protein
LVHLAQFPNVIVDGCLSSEGADAASAILDDPRLDLRPLASSFEVLVAYGFDGSRCLALPLVRRPPKGGYRKPHWLPSLVRLTEHQPAGEQ